MELESQLWEMERDSRGGRNRKNRGWGRLSDLGKAVPRRTPWPPLWPPGCDRCDSAPGPRLVLARAAGAPAPAHSPAQNWDCKGRVCPEIGHSVSRVSRLETGARGRGRAGGSGRRVDRPRPLSRLSPQLELAGAASDNALPSDPRPFRCGPQTVAARRCTCQVTVSPVHASPDACRSWERKPSVRTENLRLERSVLAPFRLGRSSDRPRRQPQGLHQSCRARPPNFRPTSATP